MGSHLAFTHPFLSVVSMHLLFAIHNMVEHLTELRQPPATVHPVLYFSLLHSLNSDRPLGLVTIGYDITIAVKCMQVHDATHDDCLKS